MKKYPTTGSMRDRTVRWVIEAFSEEKVMTLPEIISKIKEKKDHEIKKRYVSYETFNAAVRNILTVYNAFKNFKRKGSRSALWFYDEREELSRKKYYRVSSKHVDLPEPPRFPVELFMWYDQNKQNFLYDL